MKDSVWISIVVIALVIVVGAIFYSYYWGNYKGDKNYIGTSVEECSRIRFTCAEGFEYFADEKGCGCQKVENTSDAVYCTQQDREAEVCIQIYQPVCGWFGQSVQCVKFPCANNYGNSCEACKDENVEYWTEGQCPT